MEIILNNDRFRFVGQDGAKVREIVSPRNSVIGNQSLAEITIRSGESVLAHYHVESEELFYVLHGYGSMTVGTETCLIGAGEAVAVPPGTVHRVKNDGDRNLVMLVMCSPYYRDEDRVFEE